MSKVLLQCGYMSGDTYAAATWLHLEPTGRVILLKDTKEPDDKMDAIMRIYRETGVNTKVKLLDMSTSVSNARAVYKELHSSDRNTQVPQLGTTDPLERALRGLDTHTLSGQRWPRLITAVTGWVAELWASDPPGTVTKVRGRWGTGRLTTPSKFALWEYMGRKFQKAGFEPRANIVVLWSRQSGKSGGAHLEMDTSFAGIRQLAHHFAHAGP